MLGEREERDRFSRSQGGNEQGRVGYGISSASGLPELWIAGWDDDGLDYGCHGSDQQLLQAAGPERDPVYGAIAADQRLTDGTAELSASGSAGDGLHAHSEHRRPVRAAQARGNSERSVV